MYLTAIRPTDGDVMACILGCSAGEYSNTTFPGAGSTNVENAFKIDNATMTAIIGPSKYTIVKKNVSECFLYTALYKLIKWPRCRSVKPFIYLNFFQVDFTVAVKECRKLGAVLADFNDRMEKENLVKFIRATIPSYKFGLWVSGLLVGPQGRPAWLYTGKVITSDLWVRDGMNTANCTKTCTALFWIGSDTGAGFLPCTGLRHYAICKQ